jgi:spore coat protein U-like protein
MSRRARGVVAASTVAALLLPGLPRAAPPCNVNVSGSLAFGTYDGFSTTPLDTTAQLSLKCPASNAPQVWISKGNSATYTPRTLLSGTQALPYNVYLDPARTVIWGDGTGGTSVFAPPKGNAQTTIYGRIPAGQDVVPGMYTDDLVVTVLP